MTIKLHDLRPAPGAKTRKTRVGRGEGSKGKTAGRGTKGTKARNQVPVGFEGGQMPIHMRLPKLKGFRNRFRTEYEAINVVHATVAALKLLQRPEEVAARRGLPIEDVAPAGMLKARRESEQQARHAAAAAAHEGHA